jgi:hypothetical protein
MLGLLGRHVVTPLPPLQGEWMYCDVRAANAGMKALLLPRMQTANHLVLAIDEF